MYELDGDEYSTEKLQAAAVKYNMDFNAYLEVMKGKGMKAVTNDVEVLPTTGVQVQ